MELAGVGVVVGQGENLSGGVRSGDQTGFPRLCSLRGVARVLHQQQLGALPRRHDSSPIPGPAGLAQPGRSELVGGQDGAWRGVRVETVASPCPTCFVHTPRPQCCLPSRVTALCSELSWAVFTCRQRWPLGSSPFPTRQITRSVVERFAPYPLPSSLSLGL